MGLYVRYHRWFKPEISLLGLAIDFYSTCKLVACYCIMDAGRRHKTHGSEKDFIIQGTANFISVIIFTPISFAPNPVSVMCFGPYGCHAYSGFALQVRTVY